jgi:hypothetical protein
MIRTDGTIPIGGHPGRVLQASRLDTIDKHTPHSKHAHYLSTGVGMSTVRQ